MFTRTEVSEQQSWYILQSICYNYNKWCLNKKFLRAMYALFKNPSLLVL